MLQEFVKGSQFIIITHNKKTMMVGDAILGVTMQEPGVSKKVSLKIEEAKKVVDEDREALTAAAETGEEPSSFDETPAEDVAAPAAPEPAEIPAPLEPAPRAMAEAGREEAREEPVPAEVTLSPPKE
jgi:hypothetical protein